MEGGREGEMEGGREGRGELKGQSNGNARDGVITICMCSLPGVEILQFSAICNLQFVLNRISFSE